MPETDFSRTLGADLTMAAGFKWSDDPLTDEEEGERTVKGNVAADEATPSSPNPQVAAFHEEKNDQGLRPHRSMHREAITGRTFVLELRQTPLSPTLPSNEPLHRPNQAGPDESKGPSRRRRKEGVPDRPQKPRDLAAADHLRR